MKLIYGKSELTKLHACCALTNNIDKFCRLGRRFRSYLVFVPQSEAKDIFLFAIRIPGQTIGTLCSNKNGKILQIVFSSSCTENGLYSEEIKEVAGQYIGKIMERPFLPVMES